MNLKPSLILLALAVTSCSQESSVTPSLLGGKTLNQEYSSPDGYTMGKDGYLYVSINQKASNWENPARIARISPDDVIEDFYILPKNIETGKCSPLGLSFDGDGNLYVSDNQSFCSDKPFKSGIIRVNIVDGKPTGSDLVVTGFNMSNGMAVRGNNLYVAETNLGAKDKFLSGVYKFTIDELKSDTALVVKGIGDPHLILVFETKDKDNKVGANGVAINSKNELFVNNFGDAEVMKYTLDDNGNIINGGLFCKAEGLLSVDGLQIDDEDNLWIADFRGNAIGKIDYNTRKTTIVAKNKVPVTGEKGELDAPSECIRRGNKVYVSNIDIDSPDDIQTISVIELE